MRTIGLVGGFLLALPLVAIASATATPAAAGARSTARGARAGGAAAAPIAPPEVIFTFDDGPSLAHTPKVLAELAKHGIKAVFFVNGWHFDKDARAQALLRQEREQGHYVGNHTYSHRILCKHLKDAPREIDHNEDLLEQVLGMRPELLRTPYGQHCKKLKEIVAERSYAQIGWDIDAQEWRHGRKGADVARFIIGRLSHLHGRAIVLLHDTHSVTVDALPRVLDWLAAHPEVKVDDWHVLLKPRERAPQGAASGQPSPTSPLLRAVLSLGDRLVRSLGVAGALPRWRVLPPPAALAGSRSLVL